MYIVYLYIIYQMTVHNTPKFEWEVSPVVAYVQALHRKSRKIEHQFYELEQDLEDIQEETALLDALE